MQKYLTTKSGRKIRLDTAEDDAQINAGVAADPDTYALSDAEFKTLKRIGRPPSTKPLKVPTTIRFDADVLAALKATGRGWQTRANDVLREWVRGASSQ
jgi:uncharacterized protein (DUF4415 family)